MSHAPTDRPTSIRARRFGRGVVWSLTLPTPPAWTVDALCAQTDPDTFFPDKGGTTRQAKQICHRCPVQQACLRHAIDHAIPEGVWGGTSPRQRRRIRRQRGLAATADRAGRPSRHTDTVVARLVAGRSHRAIADELGISVRTVERIRARHTTGHETEGREAAA